MAGNNNLELEIHSLFMNGSTPEHICYEIVSKYEKNDVLSPSEIESISHFLMSVGRFDILFKFYLTALLKNSTATFPWGYFTKAILEQWAQIPEEVIDLIDFSLKSQSFEDSAFKVPELLEAIPALAAKEKKNLHQFQVDQLELKTKLIAQLNYNRLYQLHDQEDQVLAQLVKNFPLDMEVRLLHQAHLEKKADEIMSRIRAHRRTSILPLKEVETPDSLDFISQLSQLVQGLTKHYLKVAPEQIYNLALLCKSFELYELSINILNQAPENFAGEWLKAEILFEDGRFLDLLKQIEMIEKNLSSTPDSTFGALYFKAQAYYGLGQKDLAIHMMESLIHARPSYRSSETLLHEWKSI